MSIKRVKEGPLLILDGRTYATFKQVEIKVNDVCTLCSLNWECHVNAGDKHFTSLCDIVSMPDDCFFDEVKPSTKQVFDIALEQDKYNACDALCFVKLEL